MKKLMIPFAIMLLAACGTSKVAGLTQTDADRGAKQFTGLTLADLNEGKTSSEKYCTQCHGYKKPKAKTSEQWKEIVPRMAKKQGSNIDAKTEKNILAYYVTMCEMN